MCQTRSRYTIYVMKALKYLIGAPLPTPDLRSLIIPFMEEKNFILPKQS